MKLSCHPEGRAWRAPEGSTWLSFGSFASLRMTGVPQDDGVIVFSKYLLTFRWIALCLVVSKDKVQIVIRSRVL